MELHHFYCLAAIIVWFVLFIKRPVGIKKEYLKYGIAIGFPIVFHTLSQQILGQSDRVMMKFFCISTAEIGIYSLFYTLSSVYLQFWVHLIIHGAHSIMMI